MSHTYVVAPLHIVFSTKRRVPHLRPELASRLFSYMSGILRQLDSVRDHGERVWGHLHVLTTLCATRALADTVRALKAGSSHWVHQQFPEHRDFGWQEGYAAFAVGRSRLQDTVRYIANQPEHHKKVSFEEEWQSFLRRHGIYLEESAAR